MNPIPANRSPPRSDLTALAWLLDDVVTVTFTVVFCPAVSAVEDGFTEQVAYAGAPVQVRDTVPL